ncbi:hypothetical protein [Rhizosphaericola mali]|uniref:Uncharacterized protein n=1 Tax=Rhizosphaericola mali TaxID=2545455 RepID=A0A5P2G288_9BACT|nr:hypothetical protein [Rhizosphaericola mali]QES87950.1 hypothetical protein E0W69_004475 [Rhizosphaericola mali]
MLNSIIPIKSFINSYFKVWWKPLTGFIPIVGIFFLGIVLERDFIIDIFLSCLLLNAICVLISAVIQIFISKWFWLFPQIIITIMLLFFFGFVFLFSPPDYYANHKTIPSNIKYEIPIELTPSEKLLKKQHVVLGVGMQPGIYLFFTDYKETADSKLYLKAVDIDNNNLLSPEDIKSSTLLRSRSGWNFPKGNFTCGQFTIYEGDWGYKYIARIELWSFNIKRNEDRKLAEVNYLIEGWQR